MPKYTAKNLNELALLLETLSINQNTLVMVDVDEVLITLKDRVLQGCANQYPDLINQFDDLFYPWDDPAKNEVYGSFISQAQVRLLDPLMPALIRNLQGKCRVMAVTSMAPGAGPCGVVPSMEDLRFNELFRLGFDFSVSFPNIERSFTNPEDTLARKPIFKQGILYARPYPKGVIASALLQALEWTPDQIIFVDDADQNLDSMLEEMQKRGIETHAIHYLDESLQREVCDKEIGGFQFQHFRDQGVWLSEEQATAALRFKASRKPITPAFDQRKKRGEDIGDDYYLFEDKDASIPAACCNIM